MAVVPDAVLEAPVVRAVHHHLVLGDTLAGAILVATVRKLEHLLGIFGAERRVALLGGDRRPHALEDHGVVPGHLSSSAL